MKHRKLEIKAGKLRLRTHNGGSWFTLGSVGNVDIKEIRAFVGKLPEPGCGKNNPNSRKYLREQLRQEGLMV